MNQVIAEEVPHNQLVIKNKDLKDIAYLVDIDALKLEMREIESEITLLKKLLSEPHTYPTASNAQSKLVMDLKPQATFLYALRTALRGRLHNSLERASNASDVRSPEQRLNDLLNYWLHSRYGYKPSFLIK